MRVIDYYIRLIDNEAHSFLSSYSNNIRFVFIWWKIQASVSLFSRKKLDKWP